MTRSGRRSTSVYDRPAGQGRISRRRDPLKPLLDSIKDFVYMELMEMSQDKRQDARTHLKLYRARPLRELKKRMKGVVGILTRPNLTGEDVEEAWYRVSCTDVYLHEDMPQLLEKRRDFLPTKALRDYATDLERQAGQCMWIKQATSWLYSNAFDPHAQVAPGLATSKYAPFPIRATFQHGSRIGARELIAKLPLAVAE